MGADAQIILRDEEKAGIGKERARGLNKELSSCGARDAKGRVERRTGYAREVTEKLDRLHEHVVVIVSYRGQDLIYEDRGGVIPDEVKLRFVSGQGRGGDERHCHENKKNSLNHTILLTSFVVGIESSVLFKPHFEATTKNNSGLPLVTSFRSAGPTAFRAGLISLETGPGRAVYAAWSG